MNKTRIILLITSAVIMLIWGIVFYLVKFVL